MVKLDDGVLDLGAEEDDPLDVAEQAEKVEQPVAVEHVLVEVVDHQAGRGRRRTVVAEPRTAGGVVVATAAEPRWSSHRSAVMVPTAVPLIFSPLLLFFFIDFLLLP